MQTAEPIASALFLSTCGVLLLLASISGRIVSRFGIPLTALFLALGMLAGSDGIGGIAFDDYALTFRLGTAALVLILFDGGLNTSVRAFRRVLTASSLLATVGVVGTAALVAVGARLVGLPLAGAILLGAVVSSTDAASVFAVLKGSGVHLRQRVALTLEAESGLNDPMAVILTTLVTANLADPLRLLSWATALEVLREAAVGGVVGLAIGLAARRVVGLVRPISAGLYPVFTLAVALLAFGVPTLLHGSGFLAVYLAGMALGDRVLPHHAQLLRVHDALAWLGQVTMFVVLGLLLFPTRLGDVAVPGIAIGLFAAIVARPLVVLAILVPLRYPMREAVFIGWMGLRGAVPIILATVPVLARAPGGERIFDLVFFVVAVSTLLQGLSAPRLARWLRLETIEPPNPPALLEITSARVLRTKLNAYYVDDLLAVAGSRIADLPLPATTSVAMIARGDDLIAPHGDSELRPGDHVYLLVRDEDEALIRLMFGREEGGE